MRSGGERKGTVVAKNPQRGMVALDTPDDGYTIIELLTDWNLEVGDVLTWQNGYGLGAEIYVNVTRGTRAEVYVQNHGVSRNAVRQQLLF
ncbi:MULTISPECIES: hypothetical protein [unclassified Xanthobacter]|uniref:hypothetical protein n=1 Tax=unclassified Xanthobacter TaxID=2623496 RepID=UPI001F1606EC|nr:MULTISPECIES: hypothetical protein [unclassified Xanthobacter]